MSFAASVHPDSIHIKLSGPTKGNALFGLETGVVIGHLLSGALEAAEHCAGKYVRQRGHTMHDHPKLKNKHISKFIKSIKKHISKFKSIVKTL